MGLALKELRRQKDIHLKSSQQVKIWANGDLLPGKKSLWSGMIGYVTEKEKLKLGLKDGKKKWCCWRGMGKKEQKNRWRRMILVTRFGFCLANSHSAQVPLTNLFDLYQAVSGSFLFLHRHIFILASTTLYYNHPFFVQTVSTVEKTPCLFFCESLVPSTQ